MDQGADTSTSTKIVFKKRKRLENLKTETTNHSEDKKDDIGSDEDNNPIDWSTLDDLRELQRAKKRQNKGINVLDLLRDPNDNNSKKYENEKGGDHVKGGLTDSQKLASELDLGNTFSIETNRRDEDAEMLRYVEEELAKRNAQRLAGENSMINNSYNNGDKNNPVNSTKDLLVQAIPDHLLKLIQESKSKNEEMLSSQMLTGIPEVDLGVEEHIRNIEKTETARAKMMEERVKRLLERSTSEQQQHQALDELSFAPKNLSTSYKDHYNMLANSLQNHRFNINTVPVENKDLMMHFIDKEEKRTAPNRQQQKQLQQQQQQQAIQYDIEPVVVIGDEPLKVRLPRPMDKDKRMPGKDKPTDNYMFEKFRKNLKKR